MQSRLHVFTTVSLVGVALLSPSADADLLRNPSFESVPSNAVGQGLLPNDFASSASPFLVGADTYSNDGSYGLFPSDFGNFPGIVAQEGIRFVAGGIREAFGQLLSTPFAPNQQYTVSAFILASPRFATNGAFEIFLSPTNSVDDAGIVFVGSFAPSTAASVWQERGLTFAAPVNASSLPYMIFSPYSTNPSGGYFAIDHVSVVPEPSRVAMPSMIALGFAVRFRLRRYRRGTK